MDSDQETVIFDGHNTQQQDWHHRHYHKHRDLPPDTKHPPSPVPPTNDYPLPSHLSHSHSSRPPYHSSSHSLHSSSMSSSRQYSYPASHVPAPHSARQSPSEHHVCQASPSASPRNALATHKSHSHLKHSSQHSSPSRHHSKRMIIFPKGQTRYSNMRLSLGSLDSSAKSFLDSLRLNKTRILKSCWQREIIPSSWRAQENGREGEMMPKIASPRRPTENDRVKEILTNAPSPWRPVENGINEEERDGWQGRRWDKQERTNASSLSSPPVIPETASTTVPPFDRHTHPSHSAQPTLTPQQGTPDPSSSPQTSSHSRERRMNSVNQEAEARQGEHTKASLSFLVSMLRSSTSGFANPPPPKDSGRDAVVPPEPVHAQRRDPTPPKADAPLMDASELHKILQFIQNSKLQEGHQKDVLVNGRTSNPPQHPQPSSPPSPPSPPPPPPLPSSCTDSQRVEELASAHFTPPDSTLVTSPSSREGWKDRTPLSSLPPHYRTSSRRLEEREELASPTPSESSLPPLSPPRSLPPSHRKGREEIAASEDRRRRSNPESGPRRETRNSPSREDDWRRKRDRKADTSPRESDRSPVPSRRKGTAHERVTQETENHADRYRRRDKADKSETRKKTKDTNGREKRERNDENQNITDGKMTPKQTDRDGGKKAATTRSPRKEVTKEETSKRGRKDLKNSPQRKAAKERPTRETESGREGSKTHKSNDREEQEKSDRSKARRRAANEGDRNVNHRKTDRKKSDGDTKGDEEENQRRGETKRQRRSEEKTNNRHKEGERRESERREDSGKRKRLSSEEKVSRRPSPKRHKRVDVPVSSTREKNDTSLQHKSREGENHSNSLHHRITGAERENGNLSHHRKVSVEEKSGTSLHHFCTPRESNTNTSRHHHKTTSGIEENTAISLQHKSTGIEGRSNTHSLHKRRREESPNVSSLRHHRTGAEDSSREPSHYHQTEGVSRANSLQHQNENSRHTSLQHKGRTDSHHSYLDEENGLPISLQHKHKLITNGSSSDGESSMSSLPLLDLVSRHHSPYSKSRAADRGGNSTLSSHHWKTKLTPDFTSDGESSTGSLNLFPDTLPQSTLAPSESTFSSSLSTQSLPWNVRVKEEPVDVPASTSDGLRLASSPPPANTSTSGLLERNVLVVKDERIELFDPSRVKREVPVRVKEEPEEDHDTGGSALWGAGLNLAPHVKTEPLEMTKSEPFLEEDGGNHAKIRKLMKATMKTLGLDLKRNQGIPRLWDGSTPESLYDYLQSWLVEMGCSVWEAPNASFTFTWEVNLRRIAVASIARDDLESFTRDIYRHMKEQPSYKAFVKGLMERKVDM